MKKKKSINERKVVKVLNEFDSIFIKEKVSETEAMLIIAAVINKFFSALSITSFNALHKELHNVAEAFVNDMRKSIHKSIDDPTFEDVN